MKIERNSTIEALRIVSMFFIVWFHLCGRGLGLFSRDLPSGGGGDLLFVILHALGLVGVPVFIFISGYYGVHFKWTRLKDIVLQCFLYTFLLYIVGCLFLPIFEIRVALLQLFGASGLWFIYCYIVLYIFSDGINSVLTKLDFKTFSLVVLFFIYISIGLWVGKSSAINLFTVIEYYVVARYVRRFGDKYKQILKWVFFPSVLLFLSPICYGYYSGYYSAISPYVHSYYNPMLIGIAMSLVVFANDLRTRSKAINYISGSMLAVYIIHEGNPIVPQLVGPLFHFQAFSLWNALLVIMLIFAVSISLDKLRLKVMRILEI